ncbi:hypothetical protein SAMN04489844_2750 [Nocardioides exalbidus]|uniref:DUF6752 domain-containing protein n=1 Tax=Nocardioides exalbidus TaxID=402596 RepID=A0A1H4UEW3_9ACTN|nr:DUF6752 domain-containing protein [Nocardioides exalbidus]SEC67150.1 hypothetical protein SAMN04489844_2750 [Nocardioides exalbidus]
MTQVVHLHVGGPKSGTTFIQQVLDHNRAALARAGVLVVGPRLELIHAAMAVRGDQRLADLPAAAADAWDRVTEQVREWQGDAAIVSYELFANASVEQVRTALERLDGIEVHVVVSARDLGKAIASSWQEQLKFGITKPLDAWSPPQESAVDSEWGWRTMQPANVAARWGADLPASQVHVVTVPARSAGADELWHRFASATGLTGVDDLDLGVERANESLGVVEAELLRRVNGAVDGRITGGRQKSLWVRDLLAHTILAPIGREPIGLTPAQADEAAVQADAAIAAITAAGYQVHGDLEDLRPAPANGRLPSEVADSEVAESAALALADLLVWAREAGADVRTPAPTAQVEEPAGRVKVAVRGSLARLASPVRDRRVARLEKRIAELEAEVEASRALHLRVATLSDVVAQLLLPAAQQDEEITMSALRTYRGRSL